MYFCRNFSPYLACRMQRRQGCWIYRYDLRLFLQHVASCSVRLVKHVVGCCLMQTEQQRRVGYAAAHMIVMCSHDDCHQTVLQGHCQPVSCLTASVDRSVVASADSGPDSLMVVWDVQSASPLWSVSKPHKYGCAALQLSPNGYQLIAMSAQTPGTMEQQLISIWNLNSTAQIPVSIAGIPAGESKTTFCLHPDGHELITNGKDHVCFWKVTPSSISLATSPTRRLEFKRAEGAYFTKSCYLPDGLQVMLLFATRLSLSRTSWSLSCQQILCVHSHS